MVAMDAAICKGYRPGCIGKIVALHALYYSDVAGFGVRFEAKVAKELSEFCERYNEHRDGLWLALRDGEIYGSIAIDAIHAETQGAHLRWFITAEGVRGKGIGNALISSAVEFCRSNNYKRVYLWTFEGLAAARHLYEKYGFRLALQQRGTQWGTEVTEQLFELRS